MDAVHKIIEFQNEHKLTRHAWARMSGRGLSPSAIHLVLNYGRVVHIRGATIYVVGRKEVVRYRPEGIELSPIEGVQVVCTPQGTILTVYRNRDFRGLRHRCRRYRTAA